MVSLTQRLMVLSIPKQFIRSFVWGNMIHHRCKGDFLLSFTVHTKRMFNQIHPPILLPTRTISSLCSSTSFCVFRFMNVGFAIEIRGDILTPRVTTRFHRFNRNCYHLQSTTRLPTVSPYYQHNHLQQQNDSRSLGLYDNLVCQ